MEGHGVADLLTPAVEEEVGHGEKEGEEYAIGDVER